MQIYAQNMQVYVKICNIYAVIRKNISKYEHLICKYMWKYAFNMQIYVTICIRNMHLHVKKWTQNA